MLIETVLTGLIAPVAMLTQSAAVVSILAGRDGGWQPQRRDDGGVPFGQTARQYRNHTLFGLALASLLIGGFLIANTFSIVVSQRTRELAVMRAIGASTRFLLTDGVLQAAIMLVGSVTAGVGIGLGFGALLDGTGMPFALELGPILGGAGLLLGLGLIGAAVATARIASVDPVTALGENR